MKLSLDIRTSLTQTLTPQQIQYLKMLQLPVVQLEQFLQQEIEQNPMLSDANSPDSELFDYEEEPAPINDFDESKFLELDSYEDNSDYEDNSYDTNGSESFYKYNNDEDPDPFDLYSMVWQDDSELALQGNDNYDGDDQPQFQIKAQTSLEEDLIEQLNLLNLSEEKNLLGKYIIGNIDEDGYLRHDLNDIVDDTNSLIADINFKMQSSGYLKFIENNNSKNKNPASMYTISRESLDLLENAKKLNEDSFYQNNSSNNNLSNFKSEIKILNPITVADAEEVLSIIQKLDPPGIASRDMKECLIAQCKAFTEPSMSQQLALKILNDAYEPFIKKHYQTIIKQLGITEEDIKSAIEVIKRLNPKPGGGDTYSEINTVIPDFIVEIDDESGELMIALNDARLPNLKLSKAYESLQKEARQKKFNKETKSWIRGKREDAKFMIQAIKQRKNTMLKVMTAIASLQKNFFFEGKQGLKPLIYKDVAEETGLDISTVCRIVNGKYVQTEFGTFELKYFFSEALISDDGEDVSTTVIKDKIKEIISTESKSKPYSDELLSKLLKESGFNVARRTVAKYREQMRIPVARLRVEI